MSEAPGYVALGLVCFLAVSVSTHLFLKSREERRAKDSKDSELNQKIETLLKIIDEYKRRESELLIKHEGDRQKLQLLEEEKQKQLDQVEEENQELKRLQEENQNLLIESEGNKQRIQQLELELQRQLSELSSYKQKQESLESINRELSVKSGKDNERLQALENANQDLRTRTESYQNKLQELEANNKNLSVEVATKNQKTQQLEEEKINRINEEESLKRKIKELEENNQKLLIESEGAKKLQEISISSSRFYEEFLEKGLDKDLTNLVRYQEFYREYSQIIEDWKQQAELEKNRVKAGKIYEGNWGERIIELFSPEELDYIDLEEQPASSQGGKADFKLVFRNSRNKQSSTNSIRIMVELKYSFGEISLNQQFSTTKSDLRKALEVAKYSPEPYRFIFLVTNREFEIEEYKKSETIWVVSDRDYEKFGLGRSRTEGEPILAIMTPEASFRWVRMLYLLFWLAPTTRKVDVLPQAESIEKLDQKIADFIRDCHSMTEEAQGASFAILKLVEQFFEDLEKKFKQAKNKLLKSEKALNNVKEKNTTLWGEYKNLSLSFSDAISQEPIALEVIEEEEG